jgi:chemotaxis protein methyltransferase CheR
MAIATERQKSLPSGNANAPLAAVVRHDQDFLKFSELIFRIAGISMAASKKPLVCSRLAKRLKHHNLNSYGDYFRLVTAASGKDELQMMVDLLTTNETHFFREPKHFDFLKQWIVPRRRKGAVFRAWSAACSSGEEPYSIAMVLDELLGNQPWEVLASDISTRILDKARNGLFPMERLPEIPKPYLSRHCLRGVGEYEGSLLIDATLRERVRFMAHNLTETPPKLGEFDVIFLRNVMIYFDMETKQKVVARLLPLLRPGGHFLIGHSESLNGVTDALKSVAPAIYHKPE